MYDKFKRQINYLRISITDRCNLRCEYCMPSDGVTKKSHNDILSYEHIINIVSKALEMGITKIRLTGGEPLVRKGIIQFVRTLSQLQGLSELTMTTNGVLLTAMASPLKDAGLDRLNISLDTLNPEKYRSMTRGGDISKVISGIDAAIEAGFQHTKLNTVLIPGFNDDEIETINRFCIEKGMTMQRINHYSLHDINSIDHRYKAERPLACGQCNRIRLTADGKLKPCLFSDTEIPVDLENIEASLASAIGSKPEKGFKNTRRGNWEIGG